MAKKGGLGRGLNALFEIADNEVRKDGAVLLPIEELSPNENQPRKEFSPEALEDLSESIKKHGILQPILVKPMPDTSYMIIAGERRYRAARLAGLKEVPVIIKEISERDVSEIALIENLQREDLNPIEESLGYKSLQETYSLTQEEISAAVGKSRSAIANSLRLLSLPSEVIEMLRAGELTGGHARALLSLENEKTIVAAAKRIADTGASVREAEKLVREKKGKAEKAVPSFLKEAELSLREATGKKITVSGTENKGKLVIEFFSRDELIELANLLSGEKK